MSVMIRNLDELGRITIPKEMRRGLGWKEKEAVIIKLDGKFITLLKHEIGCCICGELENLNYKVNDMSLCKMCKTKIVEL